MYYQTEIVSNKNNLRKVWTIIKQVINRKKSSKTHDKFMYNNREITDPQTVADGFNNYFVNIGPTLASKIPDKDVSHKKIPTSKYKNLIILKSNKWNGNKECYQSTQRVGAWTRWYSIQEYLTYQGFHLISSYKYNKLIIWARCLS